MSRYVPSGLSMTNICSAPKFVEQLYEIRQAIPITGYKRLFLVLSKSATISNLIMS
jgi:hypothetical protein